MIETWLNLSMSTYNFEIVYLAKYLLYTMFVAI